MILKAKKDYWIGTYIGVKIRNDEVEYEGNDYELTIAVSLKPLDPLVKGRDYRTHRPIDKNVSKDIAEKILKFLKTGESIAKPIIFETIDSIAKQAQNQELPENQELKVIRATLLENFGPEAREGEFRGIADENLSTERMLVHVLDALYQKIVTNE